MKSQPFAPAATWCVLPLFGLLSCRWSSVGAFYPFSRNHYAYNTRSHEYYQWPDVAAAAKKAYTLRYQLLTYIYSAFFLAHTQGGTVARPLLFTDSTDLGARWVQHQAVHVSICQVRTARSARPAVMVMKPAQHSLVFSSNVWCCCPLLY